MYKYLVSMPDELGDWLKKEAKLNHRSFNAQVNYLLEQAQRQQEKDHSQ